MPACTYAHHAKESPRAQARLMFQHLKSARHEQRPPCRWPVIHNTHRQARSILTGTVFAIVTRAAYDSAPTADFPQSMLSRMCVPKECTKRAIRRRQTIVNGHLALQDHRKHSMRPMGARQGYVAVSRRSARVQGCSPHPVLLWGAARPASGEPLGSLVFARMSECTLQPVLECAEAGWLKPRLRHTSTMSASLDRQRLGPPRSGVF